MAFAIKKHMIMKENRQCVLYKIGVNLREYKSVLYLYFKWVLKEIYEEDL